MAATCTKRKDRSEYDKRRYEGFKKKGLCVKCPSSLAEEGKTKCRQCSAIQSIRNKKYFYRLKQLIIKKLGGICKCCSERDLSLLTLAHLNNDGFKDRRKHKGGSGIHSYIYRLIQSGQPIPNSYGVECWNCNVGSYRNKFLCPHNSPVIFSTLKKDRKLHKQVIIKYGGMCAGCGETELGFLTVEHINGGGSKEIKEKFKGQPDRFYRNLRDTLIRKDITVLCYNCNCSTRKGTDFERA